MMRVVGVDGCKGGWVAVTYDPGAGTLSPRVHRSFAEVLDAYQNAAAIGVDIPIGLNEGEPRRCDVAARQAISPRGSSVFPAPDARLLNELFGAGEQLLSYNDALSLARAITNKGITKQLYYICPKIAEVNRAMSPALQDRVVEVHPEVSFRVLAGRPLGHPKRKSAGYDERRALLEAALGISIWSRDARAAARPSQPDDLLDATVVAWTARRLAEGRAERLPPDPPRDRRGLRMEIVY
jgi:predicted RNase H-like nuclease